MRKNFTIENIHLLEPKNVECLYPFSVMHCAWELRVGAFRIFEKWKKIFPEAMMAFSGREQHIQSFRRRFPVQNNSSREGTTLLIFGNILPTDSLVEQLQLLFEPEKNILLTINSRIVGALIPKKNFSTINFAGDNFFLDEMEGKKIGINSHFIEYLWQALDHVSEQIEDDSKFFSEKNFIPEKSGAHTVNEEKIFYGKGTKISPGVVLDASEGQIIIDDNVKIMPNSVIIGPCYIGRHSTIKVGAKIYEKTSIGESCKIGGEIENSIILGYSNKQHDGFLGHSYLCEWVNLGADTNTSDLKNTYGKISVKLRENEVNTERMFLGLLCGDHTKSGINTMFTTGTVAGVSSNVFGAGYPPNEVPSYSWGGMKDSPRYEIEKALQVARTVMARRNQTLQREEEILLRREYERIAH